MGFFDKLLGGGLIEGASNLIGNALNFGSQDKTNQMNLKIAQMNNEWNAKMMQKQMDYNTEMWNKENEYNSAKNQVARLKEAGLNPYLALGNAGQAGSVGSVTPAQAQAVQMQAPQVDASGLANIGMFFSDLAQRKRLINEQVNQMQIDNMTRAQKNLAELYKMQEETRNTKAQADINEIKALWQNHLEHGHYQLTMSQVENNREQALKTMTERLLSEKELAIFDERQAAEIAHITSQTLLNNANRFLAGTKGTLNQAEAEKVRADTQRIVAEEILIRAKKEGQDISNDQARRMADSIVQTAFNEASYGKGTLFGLVGALSGNLKAAVAPLFGRGRQGMY